MKNFTKTGFFISSKIGQAIRDYNLIEDGDKILVAVSGGMDSLSLLKLLKERQRWAPVKFELLAAHIDTDLMKNNGEFRNTLEDTIGVIGVKCKFKKVRIGAIKNKTKCFWCAWNKRKTLFKLAHKLGYNKVALGHNMDDIIETTLLNLFFQGEISTMNPRQELFNGELTVIRPLCYVEKRIIKKFAKENNFLNGGSLCPYSKDSSRVYLKNLISDIEKRSPYVKKNIFRSIARIKKEYINLKQI